MVECRGGGTSYKVIHGSLGYRYKSDLATRYLSLPILFSRYTLPHALGFVSQGMTQLGERKEGSHKENKLIPLLPVAFPQTSELFSSLHSRWNESASPEVAPHFLWHEGGSRSRRRTAVPLVGSHYQGSLIAWLIAR